MIALKFQGLVKKENELKQIFTHDFEK